MSTKRITRKLSYNFMNHSWHIHAARTTKRMKEKKVYWGAKQAPLRIRLGRINTTFASNRKIRMLSILQSQDNKIILGPLVGILTVKGKRAPFRGVKSNFIDIIKAGQKNGAIVFVFTPDDIDWTTETVRGYLYHTQQKSWKKCEFPLPNVVYNRIPNRTNEKIPMVQQCIRRLQEIEGLSLFNPQFFNKQELFNMLEKSSCSAFLPKTKSLLSKKDVRDMLAQYSEIYLKPTQGKAGAGILKVKKNQRNKTYLLYFQQKQRPLPFKSFQSLWHSIKKHLISSPYIVQQAISLATFENCPYDARILVQKNEVGHWEITGVGIRVAGANRITTHVPRGGRIESPRLVLHHSFSDERASQLEVKIQQVAVRIAQELEKHYTHLGEMSMDIGVDSTGEIWFFEANAKPMKFDEPDIRKRSLDNLIGYFQFLTFDKLKREEKQEHAVAQAFI